MDRTFIIQLDSSLYNFTAVTAAAHKYSDIAYINFIKSSGSLFCVTFDLKSNSEIDPYLLEKEFMNELIDQQLRQDLEKKNGHIKNLIVEHAFAPIENLKERVNGK